MADFGNAGKLVLRKDKLRVEIKGGESVKFNLMAKGDEAVFVFGCEHKARQSERDFPEHPCPTYRWTWKCPEDEDATEDLYQVRMLFLTATSYTYKATHVRADGAEIEILKDLDASSSDSRDKYPSSLRIIHK